MDKSATPSLLPIFRSQQQAEILHLLLADPEREFGMTEIADRTGAPYPSTHREIERAEKAGLVTSRKIGRTRLVKANVDSPYFTGLADLLVRAFGVPSVFGSVLAGIAGVNRAVVFGSWAAAYEGHETERPGGDIDLLVLGSPDRAELFAAMHVAEQRLGREIQVTVRADDWLVRGSGAFHANVAERPTVEIDLSRSDTDQGGRR